MISTFSRLSSMQTVMPSRVMPAGSRGEKAKPRPRSRGPANPGSAQLSTPVVHITTALSVDLAADQSWLTGVELCDHVLDRHLTAMALPASEPSVHATSVLNQATGVLMGGGHLLAEAHQQLTTQAIDAGTDPYRGGTYPEHPRRRRRSERLGGGRPVKQLGVSVEQPRWVSR